MNEPEITDEELRVLRDTVYPPNCAQQIQTDASWEVVKDDWRKDAAWLREQFELTGAIRAKP